MANHKQGGSRPRVPLSPEGTSSAEKIDRNLDVPESVEVTVTKEVKLRGFLGLVPIVGAFAKMSSDLGAPPLPPPIIEKPQFPYVASSRASQRSRPREPRCVVCCALCLVRCCVFR